jgi:hypothetical protein
MRHPQLILADAAERENVTPEELAELRQEMFLSLILLTGEVCGETVYEKVRAVDVAADRA